MKNLNQFSASQVKALFGFSRAILAEVLFQVLPVLEEKRATRLKQRSGRKRPFVAEDGRPPRCLPVHKVLMALVYLRHNCSHAVVGTMFGLSADTSENVFYEVIEVLRQVFPSQKWEAEQKWRNQPQWKPSEVDYLIIDSFETPVKRPSLNEQQRRVYSGKKKQHTMKTQVITDADGEIVNLNAGHSGPKSDIKLYRETDLAEGWRDKPKLGDKAYVGEDILTPKKKPKGGALPVEEKAANKALSAKRIRVEHSIRRIKGYKIMRQDYRLGIGLFAKVAHSVVGLIQFARIVG